MRQLRYAKSERLENFVLFSCLFFRFFLIPDFSFFSGVSKLSIISFSPPLMIVSFFFSICFTNLHLHLICFLRLSYSSFISITDFISNRVELPVTKLLWWLEVNSNGISMILDVFHSETREPFYLLDYWPY